jgi:threonine dehydratase
MADVLEAKERVKGHVHHTPVMTCSWLNSQSGHSLFFKCELFQKAGSFKIRGATNMIRKRFPDGPATSGAAVITHSSGNHAQAVALAGKLCGVPAHIVMPQGSPAVKVAAVREYGGNIIFFQGPDCR